MGWMTPIIVSSAQRAEEERLKTEVRAQIGPAWELKILRSAGCLFDCEEELQEAVLEEAQAGWELVHRIDDGRVLLKRPTTARLYDSELPPEIDPYREHCRGSFALESTLLGLVMLFVLLVALLLVIIGNVPG